jgi:hypothetical protein
MITEEIKDGGGCCACAPDATALQEYATCADKRYVFTMRERRVLEQIRESSMRARALKEEMRAPGMDSESRERAQRELDSLRQHRAELEIERNAAAEERMRLLGHIQ